MTQCDAKKVMLLVTACLVSGCATGPKRVAQDPLEPMNRAIFSFNKTLDRYVLKPVATGYHKVIPDPAQTAISNFFSNLGDIGHFVNDVLQLKVADSSEDLMRFAMNSTFGIGGLIDFATPAGLPKHHQDFGLTLAHYHVPIGPYLVVPLFGPSSIRDVSGLAVNGFLDPFSAAPFAVQLPVDAAHVVSERAELLGATDLLTQASIDEYSFVRGLYLQRRKNLSAGHDADRPLPNYNDPDGEGEPR